MNKKTFKISEDYFERVIMTIKSIMKLYKTVSLDNTIMEVVDFHHQKNADWLNYKEINVIDKVNLTALLAGLRENRKKELWSVASKNMHLLIWYR